MFLGFSMRKNVHELMQFANTMENGVFTAAQNVPLDMLSPHYVDVHI